KDCLKCGATAKGAEEVVREETLAEKAEFLHDSEFTPTWTNLLSAKIWQRANDELMEQG
ncbi:hypothetical protein NECAME_01254, partial [Necator americanus]